MTKLDRRLLLAGATGLVGSHVVAIALSRGWRVAALTRRPISSALAGAGLTEIRADFENLAEAGRHAQDFAPTAALCALGTTIKKAGSQKAFLRVDRDYVASFARLARQAGAQGFALVSSVGANTRRPNFYLSVKQQAEAAVLAEGFASLVVARPSFIDGARAERRPGEASVLPLARAVSPYLIGGWRKYRPIGAEVIAQALVRALEAGRPGARYLEYDGLHEAAQS